MEGERRPPSYCTSHLPPGHPIDRSGAGRRPLLTPRKPRRGGKNSWRLCSIARFPPTPFFHPFPSNLPPPIRHVREMTGSLFITAARTCAFGNGSKTQKPIWEGPRPRTCCSGECKLHASPAFGEHLRRAHFAFSGGERCWLHNVPSLYSGPGQIPSSPPTSPRLGFKTPANDVWFIRGEGGIWGSEKEANARKKGAWENIRDKSLKVM